MNITKSGASGAIEVKELHKSQVMLSSELGIREGELVSQLDQHDDEKRSEKVATDMYRDTLYQTQVTY